MFILLFLCAYSTHRGLKNVLDILEMELKMVVNPHVVLRIETGTLEEQLVLLTAKPPFQSLSCTFFFKCSSGCGQIHSPLRASYHSHRCKQPKNSLKHWPLDYYFSIFYQQYIFFSIFLSECYSSKFKLRRQLLENVPS